MLTVGCHAVAGLEGDFVAQAGAGEGGAGATSATGGGGEAGAPLTCELVLPPVKPAAADTGTSTFTVAVRNVYLGEDAEAVPGFDLDGRCTCNAEGDIDRTFATSCAAPPGASDVDACDAAGGVDTQAAKLFKQLGVAGFDSSNMSNGANDGAWSLLLRVEGYNEQADDSEVTVSAFNTLPTDPPLWDGLDELPVDPESLVDGTSLDQPKNTTTKAYVANHTLVVSLEEAVIVLRDPNGSALRVDLDGAFFIATIEPTATGLGLRNGVATGKWPASELFKSFDDFRVDPVGAICTDDPTFIILQKKICESLDINAGSPNPVETCDALSFSIAFDADPAVVGAPVTVTQPSDGCPPETLPSTASCSFLSN